MHSTFPPPYCQGIYINFVIDFSGTTKVLDLFKDFLYANYRCEQHGYFLMKRYYGVASKRLMVMVIVALTAILSVLVIEDTQIRYMVRGIRAHPWLEIMQWISFTGKGIFMFLILFLVFIFGLLKQRDQERKASRYGIYALTLSGVLIQTFKHVIGRPRPRIVDTGGFHFGPSLASGYDSFPSGHAGSSFAVAYILSRFYPEGKVYFYGFAALVAFSRIYIDAHFASDIFFGAGLGIITGKAVFLLDEAINEKEIRIKRFVIDRFLYRWIG